MQAVAGLKAGPQINRKPGGSPLARREAREGYLFISPWLAGFVVFYAGPMVASFVLGFTSWNLLNPARWVGLDNFRQLIHDPLFWRALQVTAVYAVVAVPLDLLAALLLAALLNQKVRGIGAYRTIFYLPTILPGVVTAVVWRWVFNPEIGIINNILALLRLPGPLWLASPSWALPAMIIMSLWTIGTATVIFLGGLQGVPVELHEAADIDGAGPWSRFWRITVPLVSPSIFFNLITGMIGAFQVFTLPYIMTQGGPQNATLFYVLYLYENAFTYMKMGYASAMAWILFLIIVILTLVQFRISRRWVYYAGGDRV